MPDPTPSPAALAAVRARVAALGGWAALGDNLAALAALKADATPNPAPRAVDLTAGPPGPADGSISVRVIIPAVPNTPTAGCTHAFACSYDGIGSLADEAGPIALDLTPARRPTSAPTRPSGREEDPDHAAQRRRQLQLQGLGRGRCRRLFVRGEG